MSFTQKAFISIIVDPVKANLASVLFWLGMVLVIIGSLFGSTLDSWSYLPSNSGTVVVKIGSAILGAGVFAVIMKSAQFTELFQKHIYDVFYDPRVVNQGVPLIVKWQALTHALLKDILPTTHHQATKHLELQFLAAQLDYHFEEYSIAYNIVIDHKQVATVTSVTKATIVLSPHVDEPILKHSLKVDGNVVLKALRLNNKNCDIRFLYSPDPIEPTLMTMGLPIKEYSEQKHIGSDKVVKLERVIEWSQDLHIDPYMKGQINRYIKGADVRVKISPEYKVHFEKFGLGDLPDNFYLENDGFGYQRWQLVTNNDLLLPGQGFILLVMPRVSGSLQ